jgi:hypothetical protein
VTYQWSPDPVSGQGTAHARYDTSGDKWVVVTITATGCKDSCNAIITQNVIKPALTCAGDTLTCDSSLASATVTSNPSEGVSYFWSPAPVSGQNTAHARYDTSGDKWVVVTITATGCKDSCKAVITQDIRPPNITCPDSMVVHSGHASSGNFTVNHPQGDSIVQIQAWVTPAGTGITNLTVYGGTGITPTTGHVEFDANCSYPGIYSICLEATDKCGLKDICCFQVRVTNLPPEIVCPSDTSSGVGHFVSSDFAVSDPEGLPVTVNVAGVFPAPDSMPYIVGNHVEWGIASGDVGDIYTIYLVAADRCGATDECSFTFHAIPKPGCGAVVTIGSLDANPGQAVDVPIMINADNPIGGFNLEVEFDYVNLCFLGAERGDLIDNMTNEVYDWEYFTYRLLPCSAPPCQKYKILLYGQYDLPNNHTGVAISPSTEPAELVVLKFQVAFNELLRGYCIPIKFEFEPYPLPLDCGYGYDWDCTENILSDDTGDRLLASDDLTKFNKDCCHQELQGDICQVHFTDGWVCIPEMGPEVCKRGDVNFNHMQNEVGDAVLFARYFVFGLTVFPDSSRAYQICATDVNADGRTLMLADLIYLIRVIQHDAVAFPKLGPSSDVANVIVSDGKITVECASAIGGLLFKFDGAVTPTLLNANMELLSNEGNVLVWSSAGHSINAGASQLLTVSGAKPVSVIAVDREGRDLATTITTKLAPTTFTLHPAYPNPFNPNTNLSFTLPTAVSYSLNIYNVAGQLVRSYEGMGNVGLNVIPWDGKDNAGNDVSSGVYFCKLIAGSFTATNKMVMLK